MAVSCAEPCPLTPGAVTIPAAPPGQWDSMCCCCRIWPGPVSPDHVRGCEQPKWDTCAPTARLLQSRPTTAACCCGSKGTVIHADLLRGGPFEPPCAGAEERLLLTAPLHPVCTTPLRAGVPSGCAPCDPSFPL